MRRPGSSTGMPKIGTTAGAWAFVIALGGCGGGPSMIQPRGPAAARIADLWWVLFALAVVVFALVAATLGYGLFRRRGAQERPTPETDRRGTRWIVAGGILFPIVTLLPLSFFTLSTLGALAEPDSPPALTIAVAGWQWWWEVEYFDRGGEWLFETANELHIPVGRPVRIVLDAADVIHSFWVPPLHGKLDVIPGKTNTFWIQADEPGVYRGQCAEYCGTQHAHMLFYVVAEPAAEFEAWLARQRRPAAEPADPRAAAGRRVFLRTACSACHAIRGTPAASEFGPDLTHLASRLTLAAGMLPNTEGHLGGWIANPQTLKPGVKMPRVPLVAEEFEALLHYLQTLR